MQQSQHKSILVDNPRRSILVWQDRIRDPSLTALLVLELDQSFEGLLQVSADPLRAALAQLGQ